MAAAVDRPVSGSVRDRIAGHPLPLALRSSWRAAPALTAAYLTISFARGIVPNLLYVGTSLLAAALAEAQGDATLALVIAAITASFFLIQVSEPLSDAIGNALGRRLDTHLQRSVVLASLGPPTIEHLDDPRFRHAVATARDWENAAHPPSSAVGGLGYIVTATTWALVSGAFLTQFVWWATLIVIGGWLTMTYWGTRFREGPALARIKSATPLRRASYYRELAFDAPSAREARIFGLGGWLRERSHDQWQAGMAPIWSARDATRSLGLAGVAVLVGGYLLLFGLIMQAAFEGTIDLAHATLYVQACGGIAYLWMPWAVLALKEATTPIPAVDEAVKAVATAVADRPRPGLSPAGLPKRTIELRDVAFTYPGRPSSVFEHLQLELRAGQSVAIVGVNGAGKTTLVKLLCGLLEVEAGAILIDDIPLERLDRSAWQARVAAIFQDFVRYPFSARENVALGRLAQSPGALERATAKAMADDAIRDLPAGIETPLAREFGGVDLSGGQWQRIALARALYAVERGASVLILDEPTAHLDIRAEAELFDRFLDLTAGLTTILISHRFSSVRHAQRIIVLDAGRIVEDGSHAELLAAGGLYATMFREQARHFDNAHD